MSHPAIAPLIIFLLTLAHTTPGTPIVNVVLGDGAGELKEEESSDRG